MAYSFNDASSQYILGASNPATTHPITIAARFNTPSDSYTSALVFLNSSSTESDRFGQFASGVVAGDPLNLSFASSAGVLNISTTAGYSINADQSAVAVWLNATTLYSYLNGGNRGVHTGTIGAPVLDGQLSIGARRILSAFSAFANARLAECAIWSAALTEPEIASLAKGFKPYRVRPQSLELYVPLVRAAIDVRKGITLTPVNSPTVADHPRVY